MLRVEIFQGVKTTLVVIHDNLTAVTYHDQVRIPYILPIIHQRNVMLQQYNTKPHVTRVYHAFLAQCNVPVLYSPSYNPDLSPIKHQQYELDRRVKNSVNAHTTSINTCKPLFRRGTRSPKDNKHIGGVRAVTDVRSWVHMLLIWIRKQRRLPLFNANSASVRTTDIIQIH